MFNLNQTPAAQEQIAIVTGANAGLGFETVKALACKQMTVILACRSEAKALAAQNQIQQNAPEAKLHFMPLDLSQLASVKNFVAQFTADFSRLDLLINNAGVMVPPFSKTEDGFELQMAANYFGHFLLTSLLLARLETTPGGRVVNLSSIMHRLGRIDFNNLNAERRYWRTLAYSQSKLAMLMFNLELARRLDSTGCRTIAVAAHPGIASTNLTRHLPKLLHPLMPLLTQSPLQGAMPQLYAALGKDIANGDFVGPNGFLEIKGAPIKVRASAQARNETIAARLWQSSCALTGAQWPFQPRAQQTLS